MTREVLEGRMSPLRSEGERSSTRMLVLTPMALVMLLVSCHALYLAGWWVGEALA